MIELSNLQKVANQKTVLDIPSLKVEGGEIAVISGDAGSGLDHLLKLLLGQVQPTLGQVRLAGCDPRTDRQAFSRSAGVLFAEDTLYGRQTARANLQFQCRLYNLPAHRADEVLALVGLVDHAEVRAEKLSSSLGRRLSFGRAILHQPQVLLLVEPFARCDEASIALLSRLMRDFASNGGAILILASDITHLAHLCDVLYRLEDGRIVETRRPSEEPLPATNGRGSLPFKIPVRLEGKVVLVNPAEVLYAEAGEGGTYLATREGRLPLQLTLNDLEERLKPSGFFRAHRGYLVNLQHVKEVIQFTRNSYNLRLDDPAQTEIPLSKTAAGELSALLGY